MGNLLDLNSDIKQMGGIANQSNVDCANFTEADAVEKALEDYIRLGLMVEAEELTSYCWFWFGLWVWSANTQGYFATMDKIAECAISGGVDTKFTNEEFVNNQWVPFRTMMQMGIFEIVDIVWHPALVVAI